MSSLQRLSQALQKVPLSPLSRMPAVPTHQARKMPLTSKGSLAAQKHLELRITGCAYILLMDKMHGEILV